MSKIAGSADVGPPTDPLDLNALKKDLPAGKRRELQILLISDIHSKVSVIESTKTYLDNNNIHPDWIFLLGDLVDIPNRPTDKYEDETSLLQRGTFFSGLQRIATICPNVLFIPGNHDPYETYCPPVTDATIAGPAFFHSSIHCGRARIADDLVVCGVGGSVDATNTSTSTREWVGYPWRDTEDGLEACLAHVLRRGQLSPHFPWADYIATLKLSIPTHAPIPSFMASLHARERIPLVRTSSQLAQTVQRHVKEHGQPSDDKALFTGQNKAMAARFAAACCDESDPLLDIKAVRPPYADQEFLETGHYNPLEVASRSVDVGRGLEPSDSVLLMTHVGPIGCPTARHVAKNGDVIESGARAIRDAITQPGSVVVACVHGHAHHPQAHRADVEGRPVINPGPLSEGAACVVTLVRGGAGWVVGRVVEVDVGPVPDMEERDTY